MFFKKTGWKSGTNPAHVEPLPINLSKETYNGMSDEDFVKLKFRRDTTSRLSWTSISLRFI